MIHSTRMTWFTCIADSTDMSLSKPRDGEGQGSLAGCSLWGHDLVTRRRQTAVLTLKRAPWEPGFTLGSASILV